MTRKLFLMLYLFSAGWAVAQPMWHFTPKEVSALHSAAADYRIPYGHDPLQFGDLRLPKTAGPYPVAIVIHGGCWISTFADLQNTAALADALRDAGVATWNIEYRRSDNKGGGWPGTFTDVASATDFLRTIAPKYSLDLNRVIAIGHSAGGHLSLWLAGRHRLSPTSSLYRANPLLLKGVISLAGVPDLRGFREHGKQVCNGDVVGRLLGNDDKKINQRMQQSSPIELLPMGIPQALLFGAEDSAVPPGFAKRYVQKAKENGDVVQSVTVRYSGHHEFNVPNSVVWPEIRKAVQRLLNPSVITSL